MKVAFWYLRIKWFELGYFFLSFFYLFTHLPRGLWPCWSFWNCSSRLIRLFGPVLTEVLKPTFSQSGFINARNKIWETTPLLCPLATGFTRPHTTTLLTPSLLNQGLSATTSSRLTPFVIPSSELWILPTHCWLDIWDNSLNCCLLTVISFCYMMTLCLLILFGMSLNFGTSKRRLIWCLPWTERKGKTCVPDCPFPWICILCQGAYKYQGVSDRLPIVLASAPFSRQVPSGDPPLYVHSLPHGP